VEIKLWNFLLQDAAKAKASEKGCMRAAPGMAIKPRSLLLLSKSPRHRQPDAEPAGGRITGE